MNYHQTIQDYEGKWQQASYFIILGADLFPKRKHDFNLLLGYQRHFASHFKDSDYGIETISRNMEISSNWGGPNYSEDQYYYLERNKRSTIAGFEYKRKIIPGYFGFRATCADNYLNGKDREERLATSAPFARWNVSVSLQFVIKGNKEESD